MRKIYINLFVILTIIASILMPFINTDNVNADDKRTTLKVGDKVIFGNSVVGEFQGLDSKGRSIFKSTIDAPKYTDSKALLATKWIKQGDTYVTKDNIFSALVTGTTVKVNYKNETLQWNPTVIIDGKAQNASNSELLTFDPININYSYNVIQWQYGEVTRQLRQIEGVLSEYFILNKAPKGDIEIQSNQVKSKGFTYDRNIWAKDANNKSIKITDTGTSKVVKLSDLKDAIYPVTIDPTTTYYTSASDGLLQKVTSPYVDCHNSVSADSSDSSSTVSITGQMKAGDYSIFRAFVYFDTSALPTGVTITSANVSIYGQWDGSTTDFDITVQSGMPTYPHDPLVVGDFLYSNYSGSLGTLTTVGYSTSGYNNIVLNAGGISSINATGTTKFILISSMDISITAPTGNELIYFWSYEKGVGFRPKLDITYTASVPTITTGSAVPLTTSSNVSTIITSTGGAYPYQYGIVYGTTTGVYTANTTVSGNYTASTYYSNATGLTKGTTYYYKSYAVNSAGTGYGTESTFATIGDPIIDTNTATLITTSSAQLNSTLSSDGGNSANVSVSWGWGKVSQTAVNFANYTVITAFAGTYSSGAYPSLALSSLNVTDTYYFRVQAKNMAGTVTSATETSFTTSSNVSAPTQFIVIPVSGTEIDLSWIAGVGSSNTYIIYKTNAIPTDNKSDGIFLVATSETNYNHTSLTPGTTYGYRAWGKNGTTYSSESAYGQMTTLTSTTATASLPSVTEPSGWFLTPSPNTNLTTKNPMAYILNNFADSIDFDRSLTWMIFAIGLSIICSFIIYKLSNHAMASMITSIVVMGFGTAQGIVPSVLTGLMVIAVILINAKKERE